MAAYDSCHRKSRWRCRLHWARTSPWCVLTARRARRSRAAFDLLQSNGQTGANETPAVPVTEEPSAAELNGKQALFGIVQGAAHLDLRKESLNRTMEIGF